MNWKLYLVEDAVFDVELHQTIMSICSIWLRNREHSIVSVFSLHLSKTSGFWYLFDFAWNRRIRLVQLMEIYIYESPGDLIGDNINLYLVAEPFTTVFTTLAGLTATLQPSRFTVFWCAPRLFWCFMQAVCYWSLSMSPLSLAAMWKVMTDAWHTIILISRDFKCIS